MRSCAGTLTEVSKGGWRDAWLSPKHILKSHPLAEELLLVVSVRIGKPLHAKESRRTEFPRARA